MPHRPRTLPPTPYLVRPVSPALRGRIVALNGVAGKGGGGARGLGGDSMRDSARARRACTGARANPGASRRPPFVRSWNRVFRPRRPDSSHCVPMPDRERFVAETFSPWPTMHSGWSRPRAASDPSPAWRSKKASDGSGAWTPGDVRPGLAGAPNPPREDGDDGGRASASRHGLAGFRSADSDRLSDQDASELHAAHGARRIPPLPTEGDGGSGSSAASPRGPIPGFLRRQDAWQGWGLTPSRTDDLFPPRGLRLPPAPRSSRSRFSGSSARKLSGPPGTEAQTLGPGGAGRVATITPPL